MYKYRASQQNPYHLSIGAVLMTKEGKIVCHEIKNHGKIKLAYTLMRETMEEGESIEDTLKRGLLEEYGAKGKIVSYIGSKITVDEWWREINKPKDVEKTTIYFLVQETSRDDKKRREIAGSLEGETTIVEKEPEFLLKQMPRQAKEVGWSDLDESEIVKRAIISNDI